jgi:predicted signal transduction protein with EAL and GGDEF domain
MPGRLSRTDDVLMAGEQITIRRSPPAVPASRSDFGNRRKLCGDLDEAYGADGSSKLLVLVEFVGLRKYADGVGLAEGTELFARLAGRLAAVVGSSGSCYSLRGAEVAALLDDSALPRPAFLETLATALSGNIDGYEIAPAFGTALVPDEATDSLDALELADQRLTVQKRARDAEQSLLG